MNNSQTPQTETNDQAVELVNITNIHFPCPLTGAITTIVVDNENMVAWLEGRMSTSEAFPHLSEEDRATLVSGLTPAQRYLAPPESGEGRAIDAFMDERDVLKAQLYDMTQDYAESEQRNSALEDRIASLQDELEDMTYDYAYLEVNRDNIARQLRDTSNRVARQRHALREENDYIKGLENTVFQAARYSGAVAEAVGVLGVSITPQENGIPLLTVDVDKFENALLCANSDK